MLGKNRNRLWYLLGALGAALAGITCADLSTGPGSGGRSARLEFLPAFTPAAIQAFQNLEAFGFGVNNVRLRLLRADGSLAKDTVVTLAEGQDSVVIQIDVQVNGPQETFTANIELRDGETVLFSGTQSIPASRGGSTTPPPISVEYSGPGANATTLTLGPADTAMFAGDSVAFRPAARDGNGQAVTSLALLWSVKDEALGTVDANGKFKAALVRGATYVVARLLTGVKDSARVGVVPRATKVVLVSGGGQSATAGSLLPQAIVVEAQAGDNLPARPFTSETTFAAPTDPPPAVTCTVSGVPGTSIALTLGPAAGTNSIQVGSAGATPLSVSAAGAPGSAKKLALTQQPSGTAGSGTALATQPRVQVQDALGNAVPVAGVAITASLTTPTSQTLGGSLTATTDANGVATFAGLKISGPPATATLTFKQDTLTSAVSGDIVVSVGPPALMTLEGSATMSVVSGSELASPPSVRVTDAGGNAIAGVELRFLITSGTTTVRDVIVVTGSDGRVSLGNVPLTAVAGGYDIAVSSDGLTGSPIALTLSVTPGSAASIIADAPRTLSDTVRANVVPTLLPAALVSDASGNPKAGVAVKFFGRGTPGAQLSGPGGPADTVHLTTDAQGRVNLAGRRLPQVTGLDTVFIVASGIADTVRFVADVSAGNAHHMSYALQPPAQVASVTNFGVVVGFKDQFDNSLLASTKSITLQIKPGTGNPSGTLSSPGPLTKVAGGGFADFSVRVDLAATGYVIQAVSTDLPNLDTTPFEIQVGPVTQVLAHGGTEGQGVLKNGEVVIKARALDAGGNDVNGAQMVFTVQNGGGNVNGEDTFTLNAPTTGQAVGQVDWHVGSSGAQVTRVTVNGHTLDFHAIVAETLVVIQQPSATVQSGAVLAQQPVVQLQDMNGNQAKLAGVVLHAQFIGEAGGFVTQPFDTTDANGNASWNFMIMAGYVQTAQVFFSAPSCFDCVEPPLAKPVKSANISLIAGTPIDIESADENTTVFLTAAGSPVVHIKVTDGFNPIAGSGVRFARAAGGQYCTMSADSVVTSDEDGIAAMTVNVAGGYASCVVVATMTNPPAPPPCEGECMALPPPSVTNRFIDAPEGTYIWLGENSPYWLDLFNWNTLLLPTSSSTVYIPVAAHSWPIVTGTSPAPPTAKHVYADIGTRIETTSIDDYLQVFGDFVVDTVTNAGRIWLSPDGSTFGALKATRIEGNLKLGTDGPCTATGTTTLIGNVSVGTPGGTTDVDLRCRLDVDKYALTTANDFVVSTPGRIDMSQADAQLVVGGNASFTGNAYLSAGLLEIKKNFSTSGDCETRLFRASGTHITRMTSAANDTVYMNSDCFPEFATLEIANTGSAAVAYNSANIVYSVSAKVVRIAKDAKWSISGITSFTILAGGSFDVDVDGLFRRLGTFFVGSCGEFSLDAGPDFTGPFSCAGYSPS